MTSSVDVNVEELVKQNEQLKQTIEEFKVAVDSLQDQYETIKSKYKKEKRRRKEKQSALEEERRKLQEEQQLRKSTSNDEPTPVTSPPITSRRNSITDSHSSRTGSPIASPVVARKSNSLAPDSKSNSPVLTRKTSSLTTLSLPSDDLDESLRECARTGQSDKLVKLLSLGVDINAKDESGYTSLHWAAINGRIDSMISLIKYGAELNIVDHGGWTPLHYASFKNHYECVNVLVIQPTIDIDFKNVAKKTAAQLTTNKNIINLLKDAKNPVLRKLLESAKQFYTKNNKNKSNDNLPVEIKDKENELLLKEKQLLEKEQEIRRLQGELQLTDETLKKKSREEQDKRDDLKKKEEKFAVLEEEIRKKIEVTGEKELDNSVFTISNEDLQFYEEIGQGSFGAVYRARWRGDLVAAKRLKCKLEDTELIQSFQRETFLLSKMRHPNIAMLMAACCRAPELIIVTELMKSDLTTLLQSKEKLDWKEKLQMATDIARGMLYLHNMNPPMIHRDLKSSNLLVDEYKRVKVTDFGTAVIREKMGNDLVGTAAYMSPERLREESSDERTDVYSFGVVLWEILTRKLPWENLTNIQIVARVGYAGETLPITEVPKGSPVGIINMIRDCWEPHTTKRPSFESILRQLREL